MGLLYISDYMRYSEIVLESKETYMQICFKVLEGTIRENGEEMFLQSCGFLKYAHTHSRIAATYDLLNLIIYICGNPHPDMLDHV